MQKITQFQGQYGFLSNFWPVPIKLGTIIYPSVEHAYQASKTNNAGIREQMQHLTAGQVKRYARTLPLPSDWDEIKVGVMRELLIQKFTTDSFCRIELINTSPYILEEGNHWHDTFWGISPAGSSIGQNNLGKLLMEIRATLL